VFVVCTLGKNKKDPKFIVYYDIFLGIWLLVYGYTYVVMTKELTKSTSLVFD